MKIRSLRPVQLSIPRTQPRTPSRRPSWSRSAPRDGNLVPSDAPGFGMEIREDWIS